MNAPDTLAGAAAGATATLVGRIIWDWLSRQRNGNGAAGEKPVEFWRAAIRQEVESVMDRRNDTIARIVHEELREMVREVVREEIRIHRR